MIISKQKDTWIARSEYFERVALQRAGWWWHTARGAPHPDCPACEKEIPLNVWWTPYEKNAAALVKYADIECAAELQAVIDWVEKEETPLRVEKGPKLHDGVRKTPRPRWPRPSNPNNKSSSGNSGNSLEQLLGFRSSNATKLVVFGGVFPKLSRTGPGLNLG